MYKRFLSVAALVIMLILLHGCTSRSKENTEGILYDVVPQNTEKVLQSSHADQAPVSAAVPTPAPSAELTSAPLPTRTPAAHAPAPKATAEPAPTSKSKYKYEIHINRIQNCITVYSLSESGRYDIPCKAFICSTGDATPIGTFRTTDKYVWRALFGDVYGQYATRITGNILFHSVPYNTQHKNDLEYEEYNKLGTAASMGCIRLTCADAKWIYDNCPSGTTVVIYDDASLPGELGKPDFIHINPDDERRGWDPTDPDPENPWR